MTNREAFIYSVEKAGIKMNEYLTSRDEKYMNEVVMYVKAASILLEKMEQDHDQPV